MCQLAMPTTCVASISFVVCFILATPGACSFSNAVYDSDYSASAEMVAPARQDLSGRNIRSGRGRRSGSAPVYRNGRDVDTVATPGDYSASADMVAPARQDLSGRSGSAQENRNGRVVDLGNGCRTTVFGKIRVTGGWSCDHESYQCYHSLKLCRFSSKWMHEAKKLFR
eukprot:TRINITY_DN392_c0_g1_i4.p1 TRINITY_DN392_c0_g1~~TRINITY_DN392_c0_g1_i4.p1  ORF type:complete len:169 (-),score=3.09 TRINITY_DN392_c0_g1_i4:198-704(-)